MSEATDKHTKLETQQSSPQYQQEIKLGDSKVSKSIMQHYAMPIFAKNMLLYGVVVGIITSIIGQFIFSQWLTELVKESQIIPTSVVSNILIAEVILLVVALTIILFIMGKRWKAKTNLQASWNGMVVGFVFSLVTFGLFVSPVSGALANRETYIVFYENFSENDVAFSTILVQSVMRTVSETAIAGFAFTAILTIFGAVLGKVFIPVQEDRQPDHILKNAFIPMMIAILPTFLYIAFLSSASAWTHMPDSIMNLANEYDIIVNGLYWFDILTVIPLVILILLQIGVTIWVKNTDISEIHYYSLYVAQMFHALTIGIFALPITLFLRRSFNLEYILVFGAVIMAWIFAIVTKNKFENHKKKKELDVHEELAISSFLYTGFGVVVVSVMMANVFSFLQVGMNIVLYTVTMINPALQVPDANPTIAITDMISASIMRHPWSTQATGLITALVTVAIVKGIFWFSIQFINKRRHNSI